MCKAYRRTSVGSQFLQEGITKMITEGSTAGVTNGMIEVDGVKENDAPELSSDKKTDEIIEPTKPTSLIWRMSSGLYSVTTGAVTGTVGLGVGGVKWVAGKGYNAGSAVINTTKSVAAKVPVPTWKRKAKKE